MKKIIYCYTDLILTFCPECAKLLKYNNPETMPPNWTPFIAINSPDEIPEKYCDKCEKYLRPDNETN